MVIGSSILSYLLGAFSMSYIMSKMYRVNLKESGSKNLGASNTLALLGKRAGLLVLISDVLKGFIAVKISQYIFGIEYIAPLMVVLGHIFPFYLHFKGGKGFATYLGVIFALDIKFGISVLLIGLSLACITDYIVAATFTVITLSPLYFGLAGDIKLSLSLLVTSILILIAHKDNINNLITKNDKEMNISKAFGGNYRKAPKDKDEHEI